MDRERIGSLSRKLLYLIAVACGAAAAVVVVNFFMMPLVVGHGQDVEVPNIVGMSVDRAKKLAQDSDLGFIVEEEVFDREAEEGRVVRQKPEPGSSAKRGSRIRVAASVGLEAAGTPYLVGLSERQAELTLSRAGLRLGTVSRDGAATDGTGTVLVQSPSPGSVLSKGSPVDLILGRSEPREEVFVMPLLEGRRVEEVAQAFIRLGFSVRVEGSEGGFVSDQLPRAGSMISKKETIVLKSRLSRRRGVSW